MCTLGGVLACFGFFWGAWAVSVAEIKSSLHVSDGQFGLVLSAALLAAAATNAVAGSLAERWGTRTALCRSLVAWAALLVVGAALGAPVAFGAVLVGVVASGGAIDVVVNVAASAALAERPGRYVRFHARFNAGAVVGAVAVELLLQSGQSWRWIWLAVGIMALALADQCRRVDRVFLRDNPVLGDVMFSRPFADFDPGPAELRAGAAVREFIVARVRRGIDAGIVSGDETDVAHVVMALAQGMAAQETAGWLGTSAASVDRRWDVAVRVVLNGISAATARP